MTGPKLYDIRFTHEHIDTLIAFLRDRGATDIRVEMGGKHPHIYWTWKGETQKYITSGSLSDWRGTNNAVKAPDFQ